MGSDMIRMRWMYGGMDGWVANDMMEGWSEWTCLGQATETPCISSQTACVERVDTPVTFYSVSST